MKNTLFYTLFSRIFYRQSNPEKKRKTVGGLKKEIYSKIVAKMNKERFTTPGVNIHAIVSNSAQISETSIIAAGAYIGNNVRIGEHSRIYPNSTILDDTIIGNNVIIGSGSVIGGEGFGYYQEKKSGSIKHVPHIGRVVIEDDVHIGSNVSIDRSTMDQTLISAGTKINNNVHIAHNVKIGQNCLIMAGASISGSSNIGNNVVINPQAAISKHITVGNDAEIGMNSTVIREVSPNTRVVGSPAKEK
ncbi:MAG: UDP-3-O-(3-hydroxymyristoyl)glucosamine N-acyltransferase [Candidatus Izemoplasmataceae bacterium]